MTNETFKDIEKLETNLWEAADNLRANSKLTSSDYFMRAGGDLSPPRRKPLRLGTSSEADQAGGKMPKRRDKVLMLDARNVYRKVTRKIYDFLPEQMQNLAAIVWLYRGQRERFLGLVKDYLGRVCAESAAVPPTLAPFETTLADLLGRFDALATAVAGHGDLEAEKKQGLADAVSELLMEPSALAYAERHDNIEAIYKKLQDQRDTADVTEVLKELHRIVIRDVVETKLAQMLASNPLRMDYYKKYQEIIADYNREKDRATVEATFAQLLALAASLDAEQRRAAEEGLNDDELALFDLLFKENISKADRERLKQASQSLLESLQTLLKPMPKWMENSATQAEVKVFILDTLWQALPRPPFTEEETESVAGRVYDYVWQRSASGHYMDAYS